MNMHPLGEDLTKLASEELDKKYTELMRRYTIARRMNMAGEVLYQLDMMLDGIESEKMRRLQDDNGPTNPVVLDTGDQDGKSK